MLTATLLVFDNLLRGLRSLSVTRGLQGFDLNYYACAIEAHHVMDAAGAGRRLERKANGFDLLLPISLVVSRGPCICNGCRKEEDCGLLADGQARCN